MLLPFYYYLLFPCINIRRTKNKKAMDRSRCPQCKDFTENSEAYAFSRLSPEIAMEADSYAVKMTDAAIANKIDLYMMYYRIEYTRLHQLRKEKYLDAYQNTISLKYSGDPGLCTICKIPGSYDFNKEASFCFHSEEDGCSNCSKIIAHD